MATTNLLEQFLSAAAAVKATGSGTKETSYYPALSNLLDAVGNALKPKVRCIIQLKNLGAGNRLCVASLNRPGVFIFPSRRKDI